MNRDDDDDEEEEGEKQDAENDDDEGIEFSEAEQEQDSPTEELSDEEKNKIISSVKDKLRETKNLDMNNFFVLNEFDEEDGREMISVAVLAMSGSRQDSYDATVCPKTGRYLTIRYRIPNRFLSSDWVVYHYNARRSSSRIVNWQRRIRDLFFNTHHSNQEPTLEQKIKLPTQVERGCTCTLIAVPDDEDDGHGCMQIFHVQLVAVERVHLIARMTEMAVVRTPPVNRRPAAAQQRHHADAADPQANRRDGAPRRHRGQGHVEWMDVVGDDDSLSL